MKNRLLNNWPLKLLSVAAAFIIWLIVTATTNPITTVTITGIPIDYVNEDVITDQGLSVQSVSRETVNIVVTGTRSVVDTLSVSDFQATADYSLIYQETQVPVEVVCVNGKVDSDDIEQRIYSVTVTLEELSTQTLTIDIVTEGTTADGYAVGTLTADPSTVTITAPVSVASQIETAQVTVNIDDINETFTTSMPLELYDSDGELLDLSEVNDVTLDLEGFVEVTVPVQPVQSVPISVEVTDTDSVASGYRYTGVTISSETIILYGDASVMASIYAIELEFSAAGLKSNKTIDVDIRTYLPEGVSVYGSYYTVSVCLEVEALVQRTFTLDTSLLTVENVPDGMSYSFVDDEVSIIIRGLEADLDELTESGLKASISLEGLEAGEQTVVVTPTLTSDDYEQIGTSQVTVKLTEISLQTTTAEEESSGEEEETSDEDEASDDN